MNNNPFKPQNVNFARHKYSKNVELIPNKEIIVNNYENVEVSPISTKFKDILNNVIKPEIEVNKIQVRPGWIEISKIKTSGKIIYNYGSTIPNDIKKKQEEELENDPNYIMDKAVTIMQRNWDRYQIEYDIIHGDGAYNEMYVLPPVYGEDYDDDSMSDSSDSDEDC